MKEHLHEDLDLYALGILTDAERGRVERHLAECPSCRATLVRADRALAALAAGTGRAPSRDLREAIVARHRRRGWAVLPRPLAGAAIALAALALLAVATVEQVVTLEPRGVAASATALVVRGGATFLVMSAPEPPAGKAYEAWIIRDGSAIPAGLAPAGRGLAIVALGLALRPGDVAAVTVEDARGVQAPTSQPILLGTRGRS